MVLLSMSVCASAGGTRICILTSPIEVNIAGSPALVVRVKLHGIGDPLPSVVILVGRLVRTRHLLVPLHAYLLV